MAEVERLVEGVGLSPSRAEIKRAVSALAARDGRELPSEPLELPPDIDDLYRTLLEAASSSRRASKPAATRSTTTAIGGPTASDLRDVVAAQRVELENLRLELIRKRGYLEALQAQLDVRTSSDLDLGQVIFNLEKQLLERDEEIATLREQLDAEDHLRRAIDALEEELAEVESTRLWRLGKQYWALKRSVRLALRRETP
jgi:predicted RNase H-like nuclease (RuvC/YqgF family)